MKESLELVHHFNVPPSVIYRAWLDSAEHTNMTGGQANCSAHIGDSFTAWDDYIEGKNIQLIDNQEIVQSWRTIEFEEDEEDSLLTIRLKETKSGTELTLIHTNIPEGQTQYESGWVDNYFTPMSEYFV